MGEGPIEERGWVLRDSGHGRALGPSPPPGSPLRLPLNCLVPAQCPCSVPTLATLLRWCLYLPPTRAQMGQARGPARILLGLKSGSRWISPGRTSLLCDLGQQHPLPVTRGLVRDPCGQHPARCLHGWENALSGRCVGCWGVCEARGGRGLAHGVLWLLQAESRCSAHTERTCSHGVGWGLRPVGSLQPLDLLASRPAGQGQL